MGARFHIDAVFTIAGRGIVLQGTIVDGAVAPGMRVRVSETERLVIGNVEAIRGAKIAPGSVGLVLEGDTTTGEAELRALIEGETLDIEGD